MSPTHSSWARLCCLAAIGLAGQAHGQAGLTKTDINNPVAGIVTANPDSSTTITAGGGDTFGTADSFTYLHEQRTGDFDVKVRLLSVSADDPTGQQVSAKGSLQVRANLTPGSPNIQVSGIPDPGDVGYVETIARVAQDGETMDPPPASPNFRNFGGPYPGSFKPSSPPLYAIWLRVRRTGSLFQTMCSKDNITWTVLAEYTTNPAAFPATVYVGLAAAAHIDSGENPNHRVRSTFSDYGNAPKPPVVTQGGNPVSPANSPGVYPVNTVTGVNWDISLPAYGLARNSSNQVIGPILWNNDVFATPSRDMLLSIGSQGPVPFSINRYATGALDLGISPRDPVAAQSNLGPYTNPNRSRSTPDITAPASQAWFPSLNYGVLIPTVRVNGSMQWNDGATPFFPHAFLAVDSSSANYFGMQDGTFSNGRFYTRMGKRGNTAPNPSTVNLSAGFQRAAFNISTSWFPYEDGWMSGYFNQTDSTGEAFWFSPGSHSEAATRGTAALDGNSAGAILQWTDQFGIISGLATLSLPGVDSREDGMVFLTPNDDSLSRGMQANCRIKPDGSGWTVALRDVNNLDFPDFYADPDKSEFSFVHVPYNAINLVGGQIGPNGSKVQSAGTFNVTRSTAGRYEIEIPGKNAQSGMLILQAVGDLPKEFPQDPDLVDTTSLTYQYDPQSQRFVVESRETIYIDKDAGVIDAPLRDGGFYFAWVDFANPLTLTPEIVLPKLSILNNGTTVTVSWPTGITGFVLETSNNLENPWTDVPGVVNNSVTIPYTPALKKQFFRLRTAP